MEDINVKKKAIHGHGPDGKNRRAFDAVDENGTVTLEIKSKQGMVMLTLEELNEQLNSES